MTLTGVLNILESVEQQLTLIMNGHENARGIRRAKIIARQCHDDVRMARAYILRDLLPPVVDG